jgi:hypothetical protein
VINFESFHSDRPALQFLDGRKNKKKNPIRHERKKTYPLILSRKAFGRTLNGNNTVNWLGLYNNTENCQPFICVTINSTTLYSFEPNGRERKWISIDFETFFFIFLFENKKSFKSVG